MAIPSGLLGKGLFGLCLVGSGAGGWIYGKDIFFYFAKTDNKLSILGLPESCRLDNEESKECTGINKDSFQKILFKNKENNQDLTVTGLENNSTIKLKVEKTNDTETFPYGLKFTFSDYTNEITIGTAPNNIVLKKGTTPEFKINNRRLEKAWTVTTLAEKVGLTCPSVTEDSAKKCTAKQGTIKFSTESTSTFKNLVLSADVSDKITFEEDQEDYNQGFKFTVSSQITGTGSGGSSEQLEANTNYEVKYDATNGWYLSKKDNTVT